MISKRIARIALVILLLLLLPGCWNYRGLNQMAIVTGMAIDRNPSTGLCRVTFEIIDLEASGGDKGVHTTTVEGEGNTLFDAARNTKRRLLNKLYFGHTQVVIINEDIAKHEGIGSIIDWFLRDAESRETVCIVISQEESASKLLSIIPEDTNITSFDIHQILLSDQRFTSSTPHMELYRVYDILHSEGKALTLPAFHIAMNDEQPILEANGAAVFHKNYLTGYLTAEETKYFMFVTDQVQGGVLSLSSTAKGKEDTALEISNSKTKLSYAQENGKIKVFVHTETDVYLNEIGIRMDTLEEDQVKALETAADAMMKYNIELVIHRAQTEYDSDIFGFGSMINQRNHKLWESLKDNWDETFRTLDVEVTCKVNIVNTASIKQNYS